MTGRAYYVTTIAAWSQHATRFPSSHWVQLGTSIQSVPSLSAGLAGNPTKCLTQQSSPVGVTMDEAHATPILAVIEGDEGVHLMLERHPDFCALPHPLSTKPIPAQVSAQMAHCGIPAGATTFEVAERMANLHPLLGYRLF